MDQTFIKENNWAPLIVIKFDNMSISYSEDTLFSKMQEEWEKYIEDKKMDDISQFAIKITDAGRFYAKICPDFEHFSARYAPEFPPLVAVESYDQCKNLISEIQKKAFDCISEVIDTERRFFSSPGTMNSRNFNELYSDDGWLYKGNSSNKGIVHPVRIILNHIGYLQHFKEYLSNYARDEDYKDQNDRRKMIIFVTETIRQYSSKQLKITQENPEYFRLN